LNILRKLYYRLRPGQRRLARRVFFYPADLIDSLLKRRPHLVPPKGRIFTGQGDFAAMGDNYLDILIRYCHLQPHHHVLDVGCGIGRLARPLAGFLNEKGRYAGFDIVPDGIRWCNKHYRQYPNFSFLHIPLQNDLYNLETEAGAGSFRFPFNNNAFDQVVLLSVFTHMQPDEVENYLGEISRVLKQTGCCLATFFLITENSESFLDQSPEPFFPHRCADYFLHNPRVKSANIAFRYPFLQQLVAKAGLEVEAHHEGWWAGQARESCVDFQDVLILKKSGQINPNRRSAFDPADPDSLPA